ncbi:MAG: hypothetical protein Ct9H300mP29_7700 [Candidatus Neomarinimicrobiota bacterium]|nr:MAG: hypothetical protein Ct9H300mP29_7700 [Candidatus Neomarinimicrobiota bacterium]
MVRQLKKKPILIWLDPYLNRNKTASNTGRLAGPKIRISGLNGTMDLKTGEKVIVSNEQNGPNVIPFQAASLFKK